MSLSWRRAVAVDGTEIMHVPGDNGGTYYASDYGQTDGTPIAYLRYIHLGDKHLGLDMVHTQTKRRGQGLATKLMDRLVEDHPEHLICSQDATDDGKGFLHRYEHEHGIEVNLHEPGTWW